MKKLIIIAVILFAMVDQNLATAQTLSPSANPANGGYYNAGGNSLSWTTGETYNITLTNGSTILTEGEQQPYLPGGCVTAPAAPTVSGPNTVCQMLTAIYTASSAGAISYTWGTLPAGMTYFLGYTNNSNPMKVNISSGTLTGNITVTATNDCGTSTSSTFIITKKPAPPGTITVSAFCGSATGTFSIAPTANTLDYIWTMPGGLTVTSTPTQTVNGTPHYGPSITVSKAPTFIVGNVSASSYNACGNIPGPVKTVYGNPPVTPAPITGSTSVCVSSTENYSTAGSTGATSYTWSTTGSNISVAGSGLNATVTFGNGFTTGTLSVKATNTCGNSSLKTITIKVKTCANFMSPVAIDTDEEKSMFNLYPNPSSGKFVVEINNQQPTTDNEQLSIEVYDVLGNKILQSEIRNSKSEINISQFENGMYLVRVVDSNSNTVYSQRVIK